MTFAYQARDAAGKTVTGVTEALNQDNAVSSLMSRGLMVLSIEQKSARTQQKKAITVKSDELVVFTRQLATMVEAGLPLVSSLTALYEQADPKKQLRLRSVIGDLTARVQSGESFNEALSRQPRVFSRLYISMVRAGESGGLLSEILDRLAGFLEASSRLRKKVKSAMTYPIIVVVLAFLITAFLIIKVVPVFAGIFEDFDSALPAPTQILLNFSAFCQSYWWVILIGMIAAYVGFKAFISTKSGRDFWDKYKLKMPVFGPLAHKIAMSRFSRTFAQLIRSGVPILEVIDIVAETSGNNMVEYGIRRVGQDVEKGDNLASALGKENIFPPMMVRMVGAGESTGKIDEMLEKMADFWDEEIEAMLNALTSLIEPMLIVFLGVVVGGIVIALFMPIFKLNEIVS